MAAYGVWRFEQQIFVGDAYGKIIAIFIAAVLMFLFPVMYFAQRQECLMQMYVFTKTTELVDAVCNKGELTETMYEKYEEEILVGNASYEIKMTARKSELVMSTDNSAGVAYEICENYYYNKDILEELDEKGCYKFSMEDYFQITVERRGRNLKDQLMSFFGSTKSKEKERVVFYGGTIKYEAY